MQGRAQRAFMGLDLGLASPSPLPTQWPPLDQPHSALPSDLLILPYGTTWLPPTSVTPTRA